VTLLRDLHLLKEDYTRLWLRENRSWWLDRILAKYDALGNQLLNLDKTVRIEPASALTDGKRLITLRTPLGGYPIYYTTDGADPSSRSTCYTEPFLIERNTLIRARAFADGQSFGPVEQYVMVHKAIGRLSRLNSHYSRYSPAYAAGGAMGLLDGVRGSERFADGRWQGYQGEDLDIVIAFERPTKIKRISTGFLQQSVSWIVMPQWLQLWVSEDGDRFSLYREIPNTLDARAEGTIVRDFSASCDDLTVQYVRILAKNPGKLPTWHHAAGNESFIFADEIIIE
jgi:hypothetical protein